MNIQSNASRIDIETVAFMAAVDVVLSPRSRIMMLQNVYDVLSSPSSTSYQRVNAFRGIMAVSQTLVEFVGLEGNGLLDLSIAHLERECDTDSSAINGVDDTIEWIKVCKRLNARIVSKTSNDRK
jgi:hypothetical protein